MQHVAIDLGSRESQICIRSEAGEIIAERKLATARLPAFLSKQPLSRVIVETSTEAFFVADAALEHGHEVRVVATTLMRSLGVGERGIKTDQRDARKLSEVSTRIDLPRCTCLRICRASERRCATAEVCCCSRVPS